MPTDWRAGYLMKLPKKDELQECENYRETMLSVPGKI